MEERDNENIYENIYMSVFSLMHDDKPVLPQQLLEQEANLELEVGFGRGQFIRERAAAQPDAAILGIETKRKLVYLCEQKAAEKDLANLRVVHGDARRIMERMTPDACFSNIFVNFPDPWWKARHQKRMVVTSQLLDQASRLLVDGGGFFAQTDVDFRGEEYLKVLSKDKRFVPISGDGRIDANPFMASSSREKRAAELGLPIYRVHFVRAPR